MTPSQVVRLRRTPGPSRRGNVSGTPALSAGGFATQHATPFGLPAAGKSIVRQEGSPSRASRKVRFLSDSRCRSRQIKIALSGEKRATASLNCRSRHLGRPLFTLDGHPPLLTAAVRDRQRGTASRLRRTAAGTGRAASSAITQCDKPQRWVRSGGDSCREGADYAKLTPKNRRGASHSGLQVTSLFAGLHILSCSPGNG